MKVVHLAQRHCFSALVVITVFVFALTACGPQEEPTPEATEPIAMAMATATPAPTATQPAPTETPIPPSATPTAADTATPTPAPVDTPTPAPPPTSPPTDTPVPVLEAVETKVIYHDAVEVNGVGKYKTGIAPWIDLLVRSGDTWYGPERQEDEVNALPLPDGYRWEMEGDFSTLPIGEAWWTGPGIEGKAKLIGPEGSEVISLVLRIEFE